MKRSAANVFVEGNAEGKIEPEPGELESSSAGMGFEAPGQQCLSNWEMERTTVDECSLVDGSSELRKPLFPPEEILSGRKPTARL